MNNLTKKAVMTLSGQFWGISDIAKVLGITEKEVQSYFKSNKDEFPDWS